MGDTDFDPQRHKVWSVSVDVSYQTFVVAETQEEAEDTAEAESRDELEHGSYFAHANELEKPFPVDRKILPWGPIQWEGKELTVNQAIELVLNPPGPRIEYDTKTTLMPWVDSPPPITIPAEEAS